MSILLNTDICPYGPLTGPIIKPMSWRVLNDNKRFVDDWHTFVRQARHWQRVHPLRKLDDWLWENYKNRMRKWWADLPKYEQDRIFSIRKDTGQYAISHFNGPKYQRGSIMMGAGGNTLQAPIGGSTLTLSTGNNTALNLDFSPPSPLDAGFGVIRDGTLDRTNSSGTSQINATTDWIIPQDSTVGDGYEVKWNQLTGTAMNDENFTEDVWTTISVTGLGRYAGHSTSSVSVIKTFEFDIGVDGASTSDVNQDYYVECGDIL